MASYVVTGTSQGLGNLAKNPANTVIGLVRSPAPLEEKLKRDGITNVHVFQGDVNDRKSLNAAAAATSKITGGKLDVLINNAGLVSKFAAHKSLLDFDSEEDVQAQEDDFLSSFKVNAMGLVNVVHAFLPLIRKGTVKKIATLSTGMADPALIRIADLDLATPYATSKAAANIVATKYAVALKNEGILVLSISPGYVLTEANQGGDPAAGKRLGAKFATYAPHFKGPLSPAESVTAVLGVIAEKSVAKGDSGHFVSHFGNQQWL